MLRRINYNLMKDLMPFLSRNINYTWEYRHRKKSELFSIVQFTYYHNHAPGHMWNFEDWNKIRIMYPYVGSSTICTNLSKYLPGFFTGISDKVSLKTFVLFTKLLYSRPPQLSQFVQVNKVFKENHIFECLH